MNKPSNETLKIYEVATKWVSPENFQITRVKTATADGVPFDLLGNEYLYRIVERYDEGQEISYVAELDERSMDLLACRAMMFYAPWPCQRKKGEIAEPGRAHFIEVDWPRECKWNPDCKPMIIPHFHMLCEDLKDMEEGDNPDWEIMDAWLTQHHNKVEEMPMPNWEDYLKPSSAQATPF